MTTESSKNETKSHSLRRELIALIVFALVPMLLFSLVVALWGAWLQAKSVETGVRNTTSALALAVGREVESWTATLRAAALSRLLDDDDHRGMYARLAPLAEQYDAAFVLLDRDGNQLLNTAFEFGTALPPLVARETIDEVIRTQQPRVTNVQAADELVAVYMPVVRNGSVIRVLAMMMPPQRLARLLAAQPLPDDWSATLLDSEQRVIARSDGSAGAGTTPVADWIAARDPRRFFVEGPGDDNRPVLVSYEPIPEGQWTVAVSVPRAIIDRDSTLILVAMTLGGITLLALAIWLSGRVVGRIEEPVRALAQRAELGIAPARPIATSSVRELQELERAFARATLVERERAAEREQRMALEASNRAKDEFLATLSHELRTPLQAALGWLHMLHVAGGEQETRDKAVPVIERNLRQLSQLVDDLIDASRIVSGKVSLQTEVLDLAPLVQQTAETWQPAIAAKGQQLEIAVDSGVWVCADRARMAQVLSNLIANSVKFTPADGRIEVRLKRLTDVAELAVSDSGAGIDPKALPLVFNKFWQAHAGSERRYQGMGLGLAIVKSLVELQGGQVEAASAGAGAGSTFTIRLPLANAPALDQSAAPAATVTERLEGHSILLVDDEVDAGSAIAQLLLLHGAAVSLVHSVDQALEALGATPCDAVLTDIAMPDKDGFDLLREVRQHGHRMPVFAVTAFASDNDRRRIAAVGFDGVLTKPVEPDVMVSTIVETLRATADTAR